MTDQESRPMTVLTDDCGSHCGAKRHSDDVNAPLYIGHCKCSLCNCPHTSGTTFPDGRFSAHTGGIK